MEPGDSGKRGAYLIARSWLTVLLLLSACGSRVPPPGGPVDEFPPRIVSIEPESNRVNVDPRAVIRIDFDEEIMPSRGRDLVQLQPLHLDLEEKYRRDGIEVRTRDGFYPQCTYHVELSGDIVDLRGNSLGRPLDYYFSTGDSLHRGVVTGTLDYPDSLPGAPFFQATHLPDSLIYRTAVGGDGSFRLTHLPGGSYQFLAFVDVDGDGRCEPGTDPRVEERRELEGEPVELHLEVRGADEDR